MKIRTVVVMGLGLAGMASEAHGQTYRSAFVDSAGKLVLTQSSGKTLKAPRLRDQASFSQPSISKDHRTVAWLANDADSSASPDSTDPIAGRLVLFRAGHVLRSFRTDQVFWSWQFVDHDANVAFCTGPTHGGAATCELHGVASGRLQATWDAHAMKGPPPWVEGLRY